MMKTLSKLMNHSISVLLFFLWILADVVEIVLDGTTLERPFEIISDLLFAVVLVWDLGAVVYSKLSGRDIPDPFAGRRWVRCFDVAVFVLITTEFLLHVISLISNGNKWAVWVGGGGLFAMVALTIYMSYKLYQKVVESEKKLFESRRSANQLRHSIAETYSSLGDFIALASATENNPDAFIKYFRAYFNVTEGGPLFGDLVEVVDGCTSGVISKIRGDYPEATNEDIVLCALLYLGFSPTAVGLVFGNVKPSSLYNRRYRLRKHLHIPAEQNIETWLQGLCELKIEK